MAAVIRSYPPVNQTEKALVLLGVPTVYEAQ